MSIKIGTKNFLGGLVGNKVINDIWYGNNHIYSNIPQLATPSNVVVSGTTATLDVVENATSYDIRIDGTSIGTYTPTTWEYPVLDNGNLTITQVYDATQQSGSNNITLE